MFVESITYWNMIIDLSLDYSDLETPSYTLSNAQFDLVMTKFAYEQRSFIQVDVINHALMFDNVVALLIFLSVFLRL